MTRLRQGWRVALAITGLAAGLCGALLAQPAKNEPALAACYGLSALLLALGVGLPRPEPDPAPATGRSPTWKWILGLAGVAAGGLLLVASLEAFARRPEQSGRAWALFLGALGLLTAGFLPWGSRRPPQRIERWELAGLAAVFALAVVLRLHHLGSYPYGVWFDEAENALVASRILDDPTYRPVFVPGESQMAALPYYLYAAAIRLLGPGVLAVRGVATAAGLLSIVAVWGLARHLLGPWAGIAAAGLLAVCRWHLNFSRFGMAMIFASLFAPLALLLFFRSQNRGSPREAVWAGLAIGLGMQTYYVMLGIPLMLAVVFLERFLAGRWRGARALGLAAVTALAAAFAYAPVFQYARRNPEPFAQRLMKTSIVPLGSGRELFHQLTTPSAGRTELLGKLSSNLGKHLRMFHFVGDANGRHNLPGAPMLDPILGWLFAVGVLWSLVRIADSRLTLLLMWLAGMLAAGILSLDFEAPNGARTFASTPAVALLAALPLEALARWALGAGSPGRRARAAAVMLVPVAISAGHTWHVFFGLQPYDLDCWSSFSTQETRIAEVIRNEVDRPREAADIYVPDTLLGPPTETLLLGHPLVAEPFEAGQSMPLAYNGHKAIIFVDPQNPVGLDLVRRYYPQARIEAFGPPRPDGTVGQPTILWIARVAAPEIDALRGWSVEVSSASGQRAQTRAIASDFDWSLAPVRPPFTATVRGALTVLSGGTYQLALGGTAPARLLVAGEAALKGSGQVQVELSRGKYPVLLEARVSAAGERTTLTWEGPDNGKGGVLTLDHLWAPVVDAGGLLGRYFRGADCSGKPAWAQIDPVLSFYFHSLALPRPFSICWSGSLFAPESGEYRLGTSSVDGSWVLVDGVLVVANTGINTYVEAPISLEHGWHNLEVRFHDVAADGASIYLYWTRPGHVREFIPSRALLPPGPKGSLRSLRDPSPDGPWP